MDIHLGHVVTPLTGTEDWLDLPHGAVLVDDGIITAVTDRSQIPEAGEIHDHRGAFLVPGFVDAHVHYSQIDAIASPGGGLQDWLDTHIYPAEAGFADADVADEAADFFTAQLLEHGVTTAAVFCTVHPESVDALFRHALSRNLRILAGKVCMDRGAPDEVLDTVDSAVADSEALISRWHGRGRLEYAITPRFAPSSTPEQLRALGELSTRHPGMLIQTHLAENPGEVDQVASLFPEARDYTDVYDRAGLVGPRSVFAHAIHLSDTERGVLARAGSSLAHCPTSNFFLGSGVFDIAKNDGIKIGVGSDVGAGTSLNPLVTLRAAQAAAQLNGTSLSARDLLRLGTLGGAEALGVENHVGSLEPGKDADLVVLDPTRGEILARRVDRAESTEEALFAVITLGDDRTVARCFTGGR